MPIPPHQQLAQLQLSFLESLVNAYNEAYPSRPPLELGDAPTYANSALDGYDGIYPSVDFRIQNPQAGIDVSIFFSNAALAIPHIANAAKTLQEVIEQQFGQDRVGRRDQQHGRGVLVKICSVPEFFGLDESGRSETVRTTIDMLDKLILIVSDILARCEYTEIGERYFETTRCAMIEARNGQGLYRMRVIKVWDGMCSVTGCNLLKILRASHIKPWSVSTDAERLDGKNGLLLIPNIDALFDNGLITFDDDGQMRASPRVSSQQLQTLGFHLDELPNLSAVLNDEQRRYLEYHRQNVWHNE